MRSSDYEFIPQPVCLDDMFAVDLGPEKWLVDRFIPQVGISLIAASPKAGKSYLIRQMMASIATATPFFGRPTTSARILYLVCDEEVRDVWEHGRVLNQTYPNWGKQVDAQFLRGQPYGHVWRCMLISLIQAQEEQKPYDMIVIDTMVDAISPSVNFNDYQAVREALKSFILVSEEYQTHICCIHHTNKTGETSSGLQNVMASQAFRSVTNLNLLIYKNEFGDRFVNSEVRRGLPIETTELKYNPETQLLRIGNTQAYITEERILRYVREQQPISLTPIIQYMKGNSPDEVKGALGRLQEEGLIHYSGNRYAVFLD